MTRLPEMNPEQLMRAVAAAFEKGDLGPLLAAIHPDIVWKSASREPGLFSFGGDYKNRSGVLALTSKIALDYTFLRLEPKEIVGKGNTVWGLFDAEVKYRSPREGKPSKSLAFEIAFRWLLSDGKIIEHQSFFDTAFVLQQTQATSQA